MNFMDFHCHLDSREFDGERKEIVDECFASGFSRLVTVADPYEEGSLENTLEALDFNRNVYCMIAAHPHNADQYTPGIEKRVLTLMENPRAIGLGETGLDFYYHLSTPDNQRKVFRRQAAIARELRSPLTIHSREAEKEVLAILEEEKFPLPVVFHCYTGNREDAEEILERGYYISISGIVTFKKSGYLREIVEIIPLERIFTETDAPYLSPEPFRGKTNRPSRVKWVAEKIAQLKNIPVSQLNTAVGDNFTRLFPGQS